MATKRKTRPVLEIPLTLTDRVVNATGVLLLAALVVVPAVAWSDLPDRVPMHFGFSGVADSWAGRWMVWVPAGVSFLLWAGLMLLSRYPHAFNYPWRVTEENARDLYRLSRSMLFWLNTECLLLFAIVQWTMIRTAHNETDGLGVLFLPATLIAIFGTMGYFMYLSSKAVNRAAR